MKIKAEFTPEISLSDIERRWIRKVMESAAFQAESEIRKARKPQLRLIKGGKEE